MPVSFVRLDVGPGMGIEDFCTGLLRETGALVVPGSRFGMEGYARIGYCARAETLRAGLGALSGRLRKLG